MFLELDADAADAEFLSRVQVLSKNGELLLNFITCFDERTLMATLPVGSDWIDLRLRAQQKVGISEFCDVRINVF